MKAAHVWSDEDWDQDAEGNLREFGGAVLWHHGVHTVDCDFWCNVTHDARLWYLPLVTLKRQIDALPRHGRGLIKYAGAKVPTARGYCVPRAMFLTWPTARSVSFGECGALVDMLNEAKSQAKGDRGATCEALVLRALQGGWVTVHCHVTPVREKARQLRGHDLDVGVLGQTWEVKADLIESANLFFQTHTRNNGWHEARS